MTAKPLRRVLAPLVLVAAAAVVLSGCSTAPQQSVKADATHAVVAPATTTTTTATTSKLRSTQLAPASSTPAVVNGGPLKVSGKRKIVVDPTTPVGSKQSAVSAGAGQGYATSVEANWNSYTVHLVASGNIERYRYFASLAASTLNSEAGTHINIAGGEVGSVPSSPAVGNIYLVVSSSSACSGAWAGCTQSSWDSTAFGQYNDDAAVISINGGYVNGYSTAQTAHVVLHEFGHAMGLDHYSTTYAGRTQIMHPSSYAAPTYQSGDLRGLDSLTANSTHTPAGSLSATGGSNTITVSGVAYDPDTQSQTGSQVLLDGALVATNINNAWYSSGSLQTIGGIYHQFTGISAGTHTVTLRAQNKNTGTWYGLVSKTVTVAGLQFSTPKLSGTAATNSTLTAVTGTWGPAGVTLTNQWLEDGKPLTGQTGSTLKVTSAMVGHTIAVTTTGSKSGLTTVARTSAAVKVAAGTLGVPYAPKLTSSWRVGSTITADTGTWQPAPVAMSYQWYQDGVALRGQTNPTLALGTGQYKHHLKVLVTGRATGYTARAVFSAYSPTIAVGIVSSSKTATIAGSTAVAYGQTLTATAGTWTPGTAVHYQWYIDVTPIKGATGGTWSIPRTDWVGHTVHVAITGTKSVYATHTTTSPAYGISGATLTAATPSVTGTPTVGQTLTATPGAWTSGTTLHYQWYADTGLIGGATGSTLNLTSQLTGHTYYVVITGTKAGYSTQVKASARTGLVTDPNATPASTSNSTTPGTGATTTASAVNGTLTTGGTLTPGQSLTDWTGFHLLEMQTDGNLVLYSHGKAIWDTRTKAAGAHFTIQTDGNMVVYSSTGRALWSSHTNGRGAGLQMVVQPDGNLVLSKGATAVWSTHTAGK